MTIQAPSASTIFASALSEFVSKADAFLQNHYHGGSESADVQQVLKALAHLQLDVDKEALEKEFDLRCDRQDLEADYYDSAWF